ncbi:MAG TPA: hypothetical protein IAD04_03450 [Candidatus Caccosoma faecigallinarum]|uniref:Uncharacterized protein n=1 Tax=Candidatus Caccosoma faecigallinarum TaxID=2840720 RepID=A0A9D1G964_9FIRM|nr:hypothetical protein [Candidatus Caccosoma faecigallinarum]
MFEISPSGLIIDDEIVYQGDIKISFNVEIKNAIYPYLKENQLDIHFTLEDNSEFNLLQSIFMGSAEPEIYYHVSENYISNPELIYSTQGKLQEKKIQANIVYQNDNLQNINRLFFVLAFHFDFSDYIDSFETSIYNQISNEGLLLDFQIGVENL